MFHCLRIFLLLAVGLVAVACVSKPSNVPLASDKSFDQNSPKSIVVIGVSGYAIAGNSFGIDFSPLEGESGNSAKQFSIGKSWISRPRDDSQHFVSEVNPGSYIMYLFKTFAHINAQQYTHIHYLCRGTVSFELQPGTVNYIGDFVLTPIGNPAPEGYSRTTLVRAPDQYDSARNAISEYSGVKPALTMVALENATYKCPKQP